MARKRKSIGNLFGNDSDTPDVVEATVEATAVEATEATVPEVDGVSIALDTSSGWLSIKDAAEYSGMSPHYIRHLGKYSADIEQRKEDGKVQVSVASLDTYIAAKATKEAQKSEDFELTAETQGTVSIAVVAAHYGTNANTIRNWAKKEMIPVTKNPNSGRWEADAQEIFAHPKPAGGASANGAGGRGRTTDGRTFMMIRLSAEEIEAVKAALDYNEDSHKLQSRYAGQAASKAKKAAKEAEAAAVVEAVEAATLTHVEA